MAGKSIWPNRHLRATRQGIPVYCKLLKILNKIAYSPLRSPIETTHLKKRKPHTEMKIPLAFARSGEVGRSSIEWCVVRAK